MQPTLRLLRLPPPPRPRVLRRRRALDPRGAVSAADAGVTPFVQLVVGDVVLSYIVPHPGAVPACQGADLQDLVLPVPADQRSGAAHVALAPGDRRDPDVGPRQRVVHRLNLANAAAPVGVPAPELGSVGRILCL